MTMVQLGVNRTEVKPQQKQRGCYETVSGIKRKKVEKQEILLKSQELTIPLIAIKVEDYLTPEKKKRKKHINVFESRKNLCGVDSEPLTSIHSMAMVQMGVKRTEVQPQQKQSDWYKVVSCLKTNIVEEKEELVKSQQLTIPLSSIQVDYLTPKKINQKKQVNMTESRKNLCVVDSEPFTSIHSMAMVQMGVDRTEVQPQQEQSACREAVSCLKTNEVEEKEELLESQELAIPLTSIKVEEPELNSIKIEEYSSPLTYVKIESNSLISIAGEEPGQLTSFKVEKNDPVTSIKIEPDPCTFVAVEPNTLLSVTDVEELDHLTIKAENPQTSESNENEPLTSTKINKPSFECENNSFSLLRTLLADKNMTLNMIKDLVEYKNRNNLETQPVLTRSECAELVSENVVNHHSNLFINKDIENIDEQIKIELLTDEIDLPIDTEIKVEEPCTRNTHFQTVLETKEMNATTVTKKKYLHRICRKSFSSRRARSILSICHLGNGVFGCSFCPKICITKSHFLDHFISSHSFRSTRSKKLITESKKARGDMYSCQVCSKSFSLHFILQHNYMIHNYAKPYRCQICHDRFFSDVDLGRHLDVHVKLFKCSDNTCSQQFDNRWDLKCHMRSLSGERPFECVTCSKQFLQLGYLKDNNTGYYTCQNQFKCQRCCIEFFGHAPLDSHIKNHHDKLTCKICFKKFIGKFRLNKHMRHHSKLICEYCLKEFTEKQKMEIIHHRKKCAINANPKRVYCKSINLNLQKKWKNNINVESVIPAYVIRNKHSVL